VSLRHTRQAIGRGIALIPGDRQKEGLFLEHSVLSNLLYPKISMHRGSFFLPRRRQAAGWLTPSIRLAASPTRG
jgi:ABC-type sugar transport system ATPase subunit